VQTKNTELYIANILALAESSGLPLDKNWRESVDHSTTDTLSDFNPGIPNLPRLRSPSPCRVKNWRKSADRTATRRYPDTVRGFRPINPTRPLPCPRVTETSEVAAVSSGVLRSWGADVSLLAIILIGGHSSITDVRPVSHPSTARRRACFFAVPPEQCLGRLRCPPISSAVWPLLRLRSSGTQPVHAVVRTMRRAAEFRPKRRKRRPSSQQSRPYCCWTPLHCYTIPTL